MGTQSLLKTQFSVSEEAQAHMAGLSLPSLKDENYKFTPILKLPIENRSSLNLDPIDLDFRSFFPEQARACSLTALTSTFKIEDQNDQRILVQSWNEFLEVTPELRASVFPNRSFLKDIFAWASINESFSGFTLRIPAGISVELPIESLVFFQKAANIMRLRIHVHLEENANLRWISHWTGEARDTEGFVFAYQSFVLEKGAKMEGLELQNFSANTKHFVRQEFVLDNEAEVDWFWASSGGGFGQQRIHAECKGSGSRFNGRRALSLNEKDHSDFWIENIHSAPDTESSCDQWAVVDGRGHSVFNALIKILPKMFRSKASQKGRSLLLSNTALSDSMPKLIIEADDVQVAHGASISSVSEDQLYYLQSRGLSNQEAREMLIQGFLEDAWSILKSEDWKLWLRRHLQKQA